MFRKQHLLNVDETEIIGKSHHELQRTRMFKLPTCTSTWHNKITSKGNRQTRLVHSSFSSLPPSFTFHPPSFPPSL